MLDKNSRKLKLIIQLGIVCNLINKTLIFHLRIPINILTVLDLNNHYYLGILNKLPKQKEV